MFWRLVGTGLQNTVERKFEMAHESCIQKLYEQKVLEKSKYPGDQSKHCIIEALAEWENKIVDTISDFLDASKKLPVKVKVKSINEKTIIPEYKHCGDSGQDIRSVENVIIGPGETAMVKTGLCVEIPDGYEIQCRSRSGLATKGVVVSNSPGTIDSCYRGEANAIITNHSSEPFKVNVGDRIAQWVLCKVEKCVWEKVDELSDSSRRDSGYGSTGIK